MKTFFNPEAWVAVGLIWAAITYPLFILLLSWSGETFSAAQLLIGAGTFAVCGLGFGLVMRATYRRRARRAR